jgi:hypothetical protein
MMRRSLPRCGRCLTACGSHSLSGSELIFRAPLNESKDRLGDGVLQVQDGGEAVVQAPGIAAADAHHLGERIFDGHVEGKVAAYSSMHQRRRFLLCLCL